MAARNGPLGIHLSGQQPLAAGNGRRGGLGLTQQEEDHPMRRLSCVVFLAASCAAAIVAQEGHPVVGTWYGDWGSSPQQRHDVTIAMTWDGKTIGGTIDPGPDAPAIKIAKLDSSTWTGHNKAKRPAKGATPAVPYVIDGKLAN